MIIYSAKTVPIIQQKHISLDDFLWLAWYLMVNDFSLWAEFVENKGM